jgi:nicotinamide riboside kinase
MQKMLRSSVQQELNIKMNLSEIKKIAVVGPESTGKSTMSAYLAKHYDTIWVPEFARGYWPDSA